MKKIICVALCLATIFLFSVTAFAAISISFYDKGDVNRDKKIDQKDAQQILKYTAGWNMNVTMRKSEADLNADGKIDGLDALILLQKLEN